MADAVSTILGIRGYKGDSVAGGSQTYGITIDNSPFDRLAQFTFYQNRDLWERKNKMDDAAALEIATISALDPASSNPEVFKYLNDLKERILDNVKNGGLNYQKNPDLFIQNRKDVAKFQSESKVASAQEVKDLQYDNLLRATTDPQVKNEIQRQRDVENKRIYGEGVEKALTQKGLMKSYNPTVSDVLAFPDFSKFIEVQDFKPGYDSNTEMNVKILDPSGLTRAIDEYMLGFQTPLVLSDAAKKDPEIAAQEQASFGLKTKGQAQVQQSVDIFNSSSKEAVAKINEAGNDPAKINTIINELRGKAGDAVADILKRALEVNGEMKEANTLSKANNGQEIYKMINLVDGIDAREFLTLKALYGTKLVKSIVENGTQTGQGSRNKNDAASRSIEWARLNKPTGSGAKPSEITTYSPLKSIIASIGGLNKIVKLSELSIAQAAAIYPQSVNKKGELSKDWASKEISVGGTKDGGYAVFTISDGKGVEAIKESKIFSNASSYLGVMATERKGQDIYQYLPSAYDQAIGEINNGQATPIGVSSQFMSDDEFQKLLQQAAKASKKK